MKVVAFGNSNNLVWMILYSLASHRNATGVLFAIEKGKPRDKPPKRDDRIEVHWVSNFSFDSLRDCAMYNVMHDALNGADLVIVSGEFFAHAPEIRRLCKHGVKIVAFPIGFDHETLTIAWRASANSRERYVSSKMTTGYRSCDISAGQVNAPPELLREVADAGFPYEVPGCWRNLHSLRLALVSDLVDKRNSTVEALVPIVAARKSIFVATRLFPDSGNSVASKGTADLLRYLVVSALKISRYGVDIIFIARDKFSAAMITDFIDATSGKLRVHVVPELSYANFLFLLKNSLIAVDSYDPSGSRRPHMTTSDALSVGVPLVTSFGKTPIRARLLSDARIRVFPNLDPVFNENFINSRLQDFESGDLQMHHKYLLDQYYELTDSAESEFLCKLAYNPHQITSE